MTARTRFDTPPANEPTWRSLCTWWRTWSELYLSTLQWLETPTQIFWVSPLINFCTLCCLTGRCPLLCPVCQETIWEAYKIFWDRLPEQDEYQSWMNQCQDGTVTAQDFGVYFGQSEEHQELVKKVCAPPLARLQFI